MTAEESSDEKMPPNEAETAASNAAAAAAKMDPETEPLNAGAASGDPKVKFIGGNQTVDLEQGGPAAADKGIKPALTKSELMKYASDPTWVKLRWGLFVLFWLAWVGMLVASVVIIIYAEKCPSPNPKSWWQKKPVYEVYVKSFKDSDGDGVGDLKGVTSELDYLANLGVGSVWLSPVYKSPMKDNGYDVSDYTAIDPTFGTLEDFKTLVAELHKRDMKVIMDFIPNHSSDQHEWFEKSKSKDGKYADYYVWADGKGNGPPNNWKSVFGGSAWTKDSTRGQYYLHQFYSHQPDLNLRNDDVVNDLTESLKFWVSLGVDGFRVDSVGHFFEDTANGDEQSSGNSGGDYQSLTHDKTYDLPEVLDLLKKFRKVLDDATAEDESNPRIMMTEAYMPSAKLARYYGNVADQIGDIAQMPLNFNLLSDFETKDSFSAAKLKASIESYTSVLPDKAWPNFCLGNHDHSRVATRLGKDKVDAMNMLLMVLQGTPFTYYGEEIGMVDAATGSDRSAYRTPMQWDDSANAGFSSGTPWLPVNPDYTTVNVAAFEKVENSHTKAYRELASLRNSETILFGSTNMTVDGDVFVISRVRKGNPGYVLLTNFGSEAKTVSVADLPNMSERGTLTLGVPKSEELPVGSTVNMAAIKLEPNETFLVTFVPKFG